jgi:nitroreductase
MGLKRHKERLRNDHKIKTTRKSQCYSLYIILFRFLLLEIELNFEEVLLKRRSIRKYKEAPIPREKILKILEAARVAPSASNKQPWHFIVVENKETIRQLAKSEWAAKAPLMIVGLADQEASPNWCSNDFGIAFEHIALAATNLGLGTCWMGQTGREDLIRKLLDIPDKLRPIAVMPVGVPDETPAPKERKSLNEIVSWEKLASSST